MRKVSGVGLFPASEIRSFLLATIVLVVVRAGTLLTSETALVERTQVIQRSAQQLDLMSDEISRSLSDQHFQRIQHRTSSAQIHLRPPSMRIRQLAEEHPSILCLQQDKFLKSSIGDGWILHAPAFKKDERESRLD